MLLNKKNVFNFWQTPGLKNVLHRFTPCNIKTQDFMSLLLIYKFHFSAVFRKIVV